MWTKRGIITQPNRHVPWIYGWTSAGCLPNSISGRTTELFLTGREKTGASRIGVATFNLDTLRILGIKPQPIIPLGDIGTFDEHGTSYPSVVLYKNTYYLYYTGWMRGRNGLWYNAVGLATSTDGVHFQKYRSTPIFDRNPVDPIGIGSCCVLKEENEWTMWYTSFVKWKKHKEHGLKHYYHIKRATSKDGIHWAPSGVVCIDFKNNREYAIAKPTVIRKNGTYTMWYSYRGPAGYRIGGAVSTDGIMWKRQDRNLGLLPSPSGFDRDMTCYPYVFEYKNQRIMFYNGNGYGASGLGIATASV